MRHADAVGLASVTPEIARARVMEPVWGAIRTIEPHDSAERLQAAGVEVVHADGRFTRAGTIDAGGRELRFRAAIIATGARPVVPQIPGLADTTVLATDTVCRIR